VIRRLFYLSLGAFLALWAVRKLQAMRPDHVARRAADGAVDLLGELRAFAGEALELAAKRETELRAEYGLDTVGRPEHTFDR